MKEKKSNCGFRFKQGRWVDCIADDGIHPSTKIEEFYFCQITKEKCIRLKECPIINK